MSLYNMLFGVNKAAPVLLAMLGSWHDKVPRFRDCYLNEAGEIVIYTRTGGGNRQLYESEESARENFPEYFEGDEPMRGPYNEDLRKLPGFLRDEDDDYDSTYASFFYKVPEAYAADLKAIRENVETHTPSEAWQALFKALEERSQEKKT